MGEKKGRRIVEVRGDGHCLLYAISESLKEDTFANRSSDKLCVKLWNEVNDNKQYYQTFLSGDTDILEGNDKYIAVKNNIMQIALTSFCWHCAVPLARLRQFINIEKTVLFKQNKHKRTWCSRSRSYPHCLTRDGAGAHYNAVNVQPEEETT